MKDCFGNDLTRMEEEESLCQSMDRLEKFLGQAIEDRELYAAHKRSVLARGRVSATVNGLRPRGLPDDFNRPTKTTTKPANTEDPTDRKRAYAKQYYRDHREKMIAAARARYLRITARS
jgi:hypothetical protein